MKVAANPAHLEKIANSPRVRPWIGGDGEVRAGETWQRTVALEWPDGGVVFMETAPGVFDGHLVFAKTHNAGAKVAEAVTHLFTKTRAHTLTASVPEGYWHVARICRALGMTQDAPGQYRLTVRDWIQHKE